MRRRRSRRNEENHRRVMMWVLKGLVAVGVFGLLSYYSYEVGFRVASGENEGLRESLRKAEDDLRAAQTEVDGDRAALEKVARQFDDLKKLYDQAKPADDVASLDLLLRSKVNAGFDPKRLALLIKSAAMPKDCQPLPNRRFLVRTPKTKGHPDNQQVRIDDLLTVGADGVSAGDGRETWFDVRQPVTMHVAGEASHDITGPLPLEYAMATKNGEYHLTLSATTARGWVEVAVEKCRL